MECAEQLTGRAGSKGAVNILQSLYEVWACARRRIHLFLNEEEEACGISQSPKWVLSRTFQCFPLQETGICTSTMQYGDEERTCVISQAEYPPKGNCKSVLEALIMASIVHDEGAGSHKVGNQSWIHGSSRSHTFDELAWFFGRYGASMIGRRNRRFGLVSCAVIVV